MSVLDRSALTESPLADLHAIASELSIDGYRRLRRPELIDAILAKQSGTEVELAAGEEASADEAPGPAPARSRSRRPRKSEPAEPADAAEKGDANADTPEKGAPPEKAGDGEPGDAAEKGDKGDDASVDDEEAAGARRRRGRRGGRGRGSAAKAEPEAESDGDQADDDKPARGSRRSRAAAEPGAETPADDAGTIEESEQLIEGVVELLANGSGFVRVDPPDPSDDDVYISSAQVKRCELVSGDRIAGPKRAPRRSERFASLIRIETINDRPASELADSLRFDDLPAAMPAERIKVGSEDPTLKAIEWLTPFGKGSRVAIVGASRSGKSEALRRLAAALAGRDELTLSVALAGVRPEEISEWAQGPVAPAAAVSFATSEEAQNSAIEPVVDQARRLAARGADAVVLIDTLDGVSPQMARKAMASARNIVDGGSVTVIATASAPIGGETTVISLDVALASIGRFPALDLVASGTLRPELLVGEAGAEAIARTRAEVAEPDDDE
ncbi:MAG TPA: Rho termination factor N-terminal domain-containing protein [Solirubrobacteraceae bacterium]|nr:Rho termination factor N-terminal domain-containing protein [Solirubrobacteraceae bacterium]